MNQYTVIYAEFFQTGSHMNSVPHFKHLTCPALELNDLVEAEIGWNNVWFLFEGHCIPVM